MIIIIDRRCSKIIARRQVGHEPSTSKSSLYACTSDEFVAFTGTIQSSVEMSPSPPASTDHRSSDNLAQDPQTSSSLPILQALLSSSANKVDGRREVDCGRKA